jgi:hypothetical protein
MYEAIAAADVDGIGLSKTMDGDQLNKYVNIWITEVMIF